MLKKKYQRRERRKFARLDFTAPLAYKVCKKKTISRLLKGYTADISQAGLRCNIKEKLRKGDVLWLSFDRATLSICEDLEKKSFIYQGGVVGRAVRIERRKNGSYDVGLRFVTREEKNLTHIYPRVHFLKGQAAPQRIIANDAQDEKKEQIAGQEDDWGRDFGGIDKQEQEWEEERQQEEDEA